MEKRHILPNSFQLPTPEDYIAVVADLEQSVQEEGSARSYLAKIRHERRHSRKFQELTLRPLARTALLLEEVDERGLTLDNRHQIANAALAGMIYGHLANEISYPSLNERYYPYAKIAVNMSMLGEAAAPFQQHEGMATAFGRQIGYTAMAGHFLRQLDEPSGQVLGNWSKEVVLPSNHHNSFVYGFGTSLYAAWDLYSDTLIEEGREDDVTLARSSSQDDGGDN